MTTLRAGGTTLTGRVRPENQDNLVVAEAKQLFAVADGMGGHRGGEVASEVAATTLDATFVIGSFEGLADGVQKANEAIVERASNDAALRGMGTTLCALALVVVDGEERLAVANVGDSRLYLLKAGTRVLEQITEDHSLVETLFRQGQLTRAEAEVYPHRNIVTRALGVDAEVLIDLFELLALPHDRYLICSDGLFNEVDEHVMADVLLAHDDPQAASDDLAHRADDAGGRDNITVIVVDVVADDPSVLLPDPSIDRVVKVDRPAEEIDYGPVDPVTTPMPVVPPPPDEVLASTVPAPAGSAEPGVSHIPPPSAPPTDFDAGITQSFTAGSLVPPDAVPPPPPAAAPPAAAPPAAAAPAPVASAAGPANVVVSPMPEGAPHAAAAGPVASGPTGQRSRFTWRVVLFLVVLAALVAGIVYAIVYFANNTYYVGVQDGQVAIFQGRPGGILWLKPTVVAQSGLSIDDVQAEKRADVSAGKEEPTLPDAQSYVDQLKAQSAAARNPLGAAAGGAGSTETTAPPSSTTDSTG
jgi:protein phosphatase